MSNQPNPSGSQPPFTGISSSMSRHSSYASVAAGTAPTESLFSVTQSTGAFPIFHPSRPSNYPYLVPNTPSTVSSRSLLNHGVQPWSSRHLRRNSDVEESSAAWQGLGSSSSGVMGNASGTSKNVPSNTTCSTSQSHTPPFFDGKILASHIRDYENHYMSVFQGIPNPLAIDFVPSYLRGSRYADKVEESRRARLLALREDLAEFNAGATSSSSNFGFGYPGFTGSSGAAGVSKTCPSSGFRDSVRGSGSQRRSAHGAEHIPAANFNGNSRICKDNNMPGGDYSSSLSAWMNSVAIWPTRWSEIDRNSSLDVLGDGLEVRFGSPNRTHDEPAALRASLPMPRVVGIYYFEVTIISKGKEGSISIGFSSPKVSLNRPPGWEPESWGYHGDDGFSFCCTESGKPYGQKFSTLDVIGCGVNFRTGNAFFTKNGTHLGNAFSNVKGDSLYPSVGMKKPGEYLRANFGQSPFVFDIDGMVLEQKRRIQDEISRTSVASLHPSLNESALIHKLISQFLSHEGYVETALAFSEEIRAESSALMNTSSMDTDGSTAKADKDAVNRQKIRAAVLEGDVDKALKYTNAEYPSVLRENESIYFKLRCRKFIEMIRRCNELQSGRQSRCSGAVKQNPSNGHGNLQHISSSTDIMADNYNKYFDNRSDESNLEMEGVVEGEADVDMDADVEIVAQHARLMREAIEYGQELQREFAGDSRQEIRRALENTFALIAYPDARRSALAPMLELGGRTQVAEELNSSILVSLGKSSSAALERIIQQTEVLVEILAEKGGAGAFVNVKRDFLR